MPTFHAWLNLGHSGHRACWQLRVVVGHAPEPRNRTLAHILQSQSLDILKKYTLEALELWYFFKMLRWTQDTLEAHRRGPTDSKGPRKTSQGHSHLSYLLDNAYSNAKFRPAFKTLSSVKLKQNASHILVYLSSSYIRKSRKKSVELILIYFI